MLMDTNAKKRIERTIKDNMLISEGDHIVLGLSGGPDSVCLFSVLYELQKDLGFTMETVHVNHKFRPGEAEEDAEYVKKLCDSRGILCRLYVYDCPAIASETGRTLEETGRIVRYQAFDDAASQTEGTVKIAVAQNAQDQCETMLFRLIRGTGPDGLAAMAYSRKSDSGYDIIRPLLDVRREDIERYCRENNLEPRIDRTNSDTGYTRNRIRHELIPYIDNNFSGNIMDSLLRLSALLRSDSEYIWSRTMEAFDGIYRDGGLDVKGLACLHRSVASRAVIELARRAGLTEDMTAAHINACLHIAEVGKTSACADLPGGYEAAVQYGVLRIREKGVLPEKEGRVMRASFDADSLVRQFGTDEICIRTRRPGDYIRTTAGTKKIKELFIDMKIPREQRDSVKLAAIGSEVLWAAGVRYSSEYRVTDETNRVAEIEIIV